MDTLHNRTLHPSGGILHLISRRPLGLASSTIPSRGRHAKPTIGVFVSLQEESLSSRARDSAGREGVLSSLTGRLTPSGVTCTCCGPPSSQRGGRKHLITVPHAANPWGASNGAVREPEGKAAAEDSSRDWSKKVFWDDSSEAGGQSKEDSQAQKQKWQAQWQRLRKTMQGVAETIRGKKASSESPGTSGQTPELKNVVSDVRRLGMSGILFGAISLLHFYAHGRLSPYADTVLDTLSLVWFFFMVLDMVLTSTTWVAGAQAFSLLMATCPSCGNVFYYSRESFRGCMTCPKCFEEMRWDGSRFVRDRPRFSRVNYGNDAFGLEPEDPTPPKQKFLPVVDVDATVSDK